MIRILLLFITLPVFAGTYERSEFGRWLDEDRDCQNTRHELLIEQSTVPATLSENGCRVVHGRWISMFTSAVNTDASKLDIDHVVPLAWAWDRGADKWDKKRRISFANDPRNLIVVEASLNRSKGAKGPDEWLPPENQCQYTLRFIRVARSYDLTFDSDALRTAVC